MAKAEQKIVEMEQVAAKVVDRMNLDQLAAEMDKNRALLMEGKITVEVVDRLSKLYNARVRTVEAKLRSLELTRGFSNLTDLGIAE